MIRRWLRRWPGLYRALQRVYYGGRYLGERYVFGTWLNQLAWRIKGVDATGGGALEHPHRALLVRRVARWGPPKSLLEVGCNAGPNLLALGRAYPGLQLRGADVSRKAVRAAAQALAGAGLAHASVFVARADDLRTVPDASIDVALTDAVLMYVGPDKINGALAELARVARRGILLNEWNLFVPRAGGQGSLWVDAHWVHDYRALLGGIPRVRTVRVERVPDGVWDSPEWRAYGAMIEADVE